MHIEARQVGDREELSRRIAKETDARQRDRDRAVLLAIEGEPTSTIQATLARSRGFVQRWAYVYRDHGIDAIGEQRRGGSQPKLAPEAQARFIERFKAGPLAGAKGDGERCTLRGKDAVRILAEEFGVNYSLNGAYKILHRHHLACLRPRPQHRHNDPQLMQQWLDDAPLLSSVSDSSTKTRPSKSGSKTKPASASRAR
jgi:transposase